ncbi:glycosyltransferase family 4 protein [Thiomicrospira aerophila]|uniref:glycosyltransferase family 4 protein n=1 Tax=Thiomicrospira aerophila TaxID=92245 RepID=UPI00022C08AB|nr:glycosyltransferase family 1 protein [Thiomicrospira aerophila]
MTLPIAIKRRIALVTDAWQPQVNGVVTTLTQLVNELRQQGHEVRVFHPYDYQTLPMPSYPSIPLVWWAKDFRRQLIEWQPDHLHIATEGPLGWRARSLARKQAWPFTTAYHTKYPEYVYARTRLPLKLMYSLLRQFHAPAQTTFAPSDHLITELEQRGFKHLKRLSRGVDQTHFHPKKRQELPYLRPIYLYVGRIATEKNLASFLRLTLPGTQIVVGDGPDREYLSNRYPKAIFVGEKFGEELAQYYASADVFVFPSKTDTFGLVNIEAMASGTPVAAYPVTGPIDIVQNGVNGYLDDNLFEAITEALSVKRQKVRASVESFQWNSVTQDFLANLALIKHHPSPLNQATAQATNQASPVALSKEN